MQQKPACARCVCGVAGYLNHTLQKACMQPRQKNCVYYAHGPAEAVDQGCRPPLLAGAGPLLAQAGRLEATAPGGRALSVSQACAV